MPALKTLLGILNSPRFWLLTTVAWALVLYTLSSFSKTLPAGGPDIPFIDKILHFGYFFGGGVLLATYLLISQGADSGTFLRLVLPLAVLAVVGALDEYHQTFTPGRSGNDPFDWLADVLGAGTGILLANRVHGFVLKFSSGNSPIP